MIVGYTTGVFDLFHVGHLRLLQRSKEQCDRLIVGVSTDELVKSKKKVPLVAPFAERFEIVAALKCVDEVVAQHSYDKMSSWFALKFNRMFVGSDWRGTAQWLEYEKQFSSVGVEIVYFDYTPNISSTKLRKIVERTYKDLLQP